MNIIHQVEKTIGFNQCDPAGIMYFAESFTLAHQLIEGFIAASDIGWSSWFAHPVMVFPLVHASCDYWLPLAAGTRCILTLGIGRLSASSITFITRAYAEDKDAACLRVKTVHVAVNKSKLSSAEEVLVNSGILSGDR